MRYLITMYAPVCFLAALALLSFWFNPLHQDNFTPNYTAALQQTEYMHLSADGVLRVRAERVEQISDGTVDLQNAYMSRQMKEHEIILRGTSGQAWRDNKRLQLTLEEVQGEIRIAADTYTLRADKVSYDTEGGILSGQMPSFIGGLGTLRGDEFTWRAEGGLQLSGGVKGKYDN